MSDNFEANRIFLIDKLRVKIDKEGTEGKLDLIVTDHSSSAPVMMG